MRKSTFAAIALGFAALLPAACGQKEPDVQEGPPAPEGVTVTDARLVLSAVKGNPAALYFEISNASQRPMVIRGASVEGAGSAVLHETVTANGMTSMGEAVQENLHPTESLSFKPGGLHVMVMEPSDKLVAGGETEVTLSFGGGDKLSFPAKILAASDER